MESAGSQNMTRGAGTCWQQEDDDGFQIWLEPARDTQKPFTDSERAQRWRLSLASLLFLTILLSDHLWFCAEAKLSRTREKLAPSHLLSAQTRPANSSLREPPHAIFLGNSSKHLWRLQTCHHHHQDPSPSGACFTLADADGLCAALSSAATRAVNMSDLYLSFCNSYSLLDLLDGSASPDNLNCSLDVLGDGDAGRCGACVQAYQRYDQHAQEKYEDFELLTQKYEPGAYSARTCMEQCKVRGRGRGVGVDCHLLILDGTPPPLLFFLVLLSLWKRMTDSRRLQASCSFISLSRGPRADGGPSFFISSSPPSQLASITSSELLESPFYDSS